jgi:prepilin-type N-terminal cleavage/methylation domain-containing protein
MKKISGAKLNHKGMSLVEVIAAMAILAIVVAPTLRMFANATGTNFRARMRQRATTVGESVMESFKAYDMATLCSQFGSNSFKGVTQSTDLAEHPTSMSVEAVNAGGSVVTPLNTEGRLNTDAAAYTFKVLNADAEGNYYDVDVNVTPHWQTGVLKMDDASEYSDAIISLDEMQSTTAYSKLKAAAEKKFEDGASGYVPSGAISHSIKSVDITNFTRNIDMEVSDTGSVQTLVLKVTYTCKAEVKFSYTSATSVTPLESSVTFDGATDTDMQWEAPLPDDASTDTEWTVYDNSGTISSVSGKLNHIFLYYYPVYNSASGFGTTAKDIISLNGTVTSGRYSGADALELVVAKQKSESMTDVELHNAEVLYSPELSVSCSGGGEVVLRSNLGDTLSSIDGGVIPSVAATGFSEVTDITQGLQQDKVALIYDVEVHVYEAGTTDEVATFIGTVND